jgi:hypothetical protein
MMIKDLPPLTTCPAFAAFVEESYARMMHTFLVVVISVGVDFVGGAASSPLTSCPIRDSSTLWVTLLGEIGCWRWALRRLRSSCWGK